MVCLTISHLPHPSSPSSPPFLLALWTSRALPSSAFALQIHGMMGGKQASAGREGSCVLVMQLDHHERQRAVEQGAGSREDVPPLAHRRLSRRHGRRGRGTDAERA